MAVASNIRRPGTGVTSFNCPHCGALAKQFWFSALAETLRDDSHPEWPERTEFQKFLASVKDADANDKKRKLELFDRVAEKKPFLSNSTDHKYGLRKVYNVHFARCYNCSEISIWFGESLVWPERGSVDAPNPDMPADAMSDYDEAARIVDQSPRGAAALLRLSIQKLCVALGGDGKNINGDIAALVERGLDPRVQMALDVVRVVGNNAVHPGELDIRDDRPTAEKLFGLVNLIVDIMISQPKHVTEMFAGLPTGALAAIEKRDGRDGAQKS